MQFGIDFGTTRTVISACDRGNYPVVSVEDPHGDSHDFLPSVVALDGERIVCGWEAMELRGTPTFTRSFKRALSGRHVTAATPVALGTQTRTVGEVLAAYATHVVGHLQRFQKELNDSSPIEVVLGVPAHSHHAQRLITMSAFSRTGITVKGLINEPSAAAFEYTHRHSRTLNSRRTSILVYDLGGGTFDASLVSITGGNHTIVDTVGRPRLGGDDLDEVLATLALDTLGRADDAFSATARMRLLDEAKSAKEAIVPQSRRIVLAVGDEDVTIPVPVFYEAASPLIDETLAAIALLIGSDSLRDTSIAGIYLVGGTTSLPVVAQTLRKKFGHRVHRSPLPSASTAVGLAIAADPDSNFALSEKRTHSIGVFREWDAGSEVSFDPLISPGSDESSAERIYRAAHNVGWFRYGEFDDDFALVAEVVVPFTADTAALSEDELRRLPVTRTDGGPLVHERVSVNDDGIVSIAIDVDELGIHIRR
ncbi:MAG: Hsp70 family protein [Corynebacterium glucuronolyticum]|nr:Hsp70 family protein [Corynebacterium glucuronolyticum]MDD7585644.1 Hsp70 family protein [Mycobacteriaceae bacterium]MDY5835392.1 Hsp70 family protein [Corynebacterium glucuronolyticum]